MRIAAGALFIVAFSVLTAQAPIDPKLQGQLKQVFPEAGRFSPKAGSPPHYTAYNGDAIAGYAFWTTELEPLERGYDGPIKMLVGMDTRGILTGVLVVENHEPYGYFSVDTPQFAAQFPEFKQQATAYYKTITTTSDRINQYFMQHRMPEGVVKAVNNTVLGLIEKGGEIASAAFERMLGMIIFLPWLVLIPILAFFLLKDADSFRRSALAMLPRGRLRWRGDELFQDINSTLAAYIRAQLTACFLIAAICSIGFALIGLPSPLVLGLLAGLLEFVPLVGPLVVAILVALLALLHSGLGMAFVVLLFLGVLRVVQDYVIHSRIIGQGKRRGM